MQALLDATHAAVLHAHDKPMPDSYDSGQEFSACHWIEIRRLVNEDNVLLKNEGLPFGEEIEEALEEIKLEMESAAADQNFAGHIVR